MEIYHISVSNTKVLRGRISQYKNYQVHHLATVDMRNNFDFNSTVIKLNIGFNK